MTQITTVTGRPVFEIPRKGEMKAGVLYTRTWRAPFTNGLTDLWRRRCHEYWERIEKRYGVILSEPRNAWEDFPDTGPVVATYATVLAIVPGERYALPDGEKITQ